MTVSSLIQIFLIALLAAILLVASARAQTEEEHRIGIAMLNTKSH